MAKGGGSFWSSLPGVLTGLAGVLTAVVGLLTLAFNQGWLGDGGDDDEPTEPDSVASFTVDPGSLDFSVTRDTQEVTVENTGDGELELDPADIEGSGADRFEVSADGCAGQALPSGRTCTVEVTFDPPGLGTSAATLVISAGAERFREVALEGSAVNL